MVRATLCFTLSLMFMFVAGCGGGGGGGSAASGTGTPVGTSPTGSSKTTSIRLALETSVGGQVRLRARGQSAILAASSVKHFRIRVVDAVTGEDVIAPLLVKRSLDGGTQIIEITGVPRQLVAVLIEALAESGEVIGHAAMDVDAGKEGTDAPIHVALDPGPLPDNPLPTPPGPPTITSITPNAGPLAGGTLITIAGTRFTVGTITVTIGGVAAAQITIASDTSLTCVTPAAAAAGTVDVVVTSSTVGAGTSARGFTYNPASTIASVTPSAGGTLGGQVITIAGTNFGASPTVTIGGVSATGVGLTGSTTITCTTPAGTAGAKDVTVTSAANGSVTLTGGFTYNANATIASVTPNNGPQNVSVALTIVGTNFGSSATVKVGGTAATNVSVTGGTTVTCNTPLATSAGAVDVVVTTAANGVATSTGGFTYNALPTITAISPNNGRLIGGTTVTVTGTAFNGNVSLTVGGAPGSITTIGGGFLQFNTPAATTPGAVDIVLSSDVSGNVTLTNGYTYNPTPTITSVVPNNGPLAGGNVVTVNGTNFGTSGSIFVNGTLVQQGGFSSPTQMAFAMIPGTSPGTADITFDCTDTGPVTATAIYTYNPTTTIASITPSNGPQAGGNTVTIVGTNFGSSATVTINGVNAPVLTQTGSTTLTCTVPQSATTGAKTVSVTSTANGAGSQPSFYTYNAPPSITTVTPNSGPLAGGNVVMLVGTSFGSVTPTVQFGSGTATNVSVTGGTTITCTAPQAIAAATVSVTVTSTTQGTGAKANGYTYNPTSSIASVTPNSGPLAGGTPLTIVGTNFGANPVVNVGANTALNPVLTGSTTITCLTPGGAGLGTVGVTVTSAANGVATQAAAFTYNPDATLASVTPNNGPIAGGNTVILVGTNFGTSPAVTFGGVPGINVNVTSGTTITCDVPGVASPATVPVTVTTSVNGAAGLGAGYTYNPTPTIATVSPSGGPVTGGTTLTIVGANLGTSPVVAVGAGTATPVSSNGTTVTCITPAALSTGTVDVTVTSAANGVAVASGAFTYNPTSTIASVTPNTGPASGGTQLIIVGTNFGAGAIVNVGPGLASGVAQTGSTTITCLTPLSAVGTFDVTVSSVANGAAGASGAFTYNPTSTITSVTPSVGPLAGNTLITIGGTNFGPTSTVTIGSVTANAITFTSSTTITCRTPLSGATGPVAVIVDSNTNGLVSAPGAFTYNPTPTITGVTPVLGGPVAGSAPVTITGTNFGPTASVTIGGGAATNVSSTGTVITCLSPPGIAGTATVVVDSPTNGIATAPSAYTYNPAMTIDPPLAPGRGPLAGSTNVTLTGSNFNNVTNVSFGNSAAGFTVMNPTTILATTPGTAVAGGVTVSVTSSSHGVVSLPAAYSYTAATSLLPLAGIPLATESAGTIVAGDVDRDGIPDAVVVRPTAGVVLYYNGDASGNVTTITATVSDAKLADINGNGGLDLVTADGGAGSFSIYLFSGGVFGAPSTVPVAGAGSIDRVVTGDFKRDGSIDVVLVDGPGGVLRSFTNDGTGAFSPTVPPTFTAGTTPVDAAAGDLDRDGKLDVVVVNSGSNDISVLRGNADGTFGGASSVACSATPQRVVLADVNGDGKLDALVAVGTGVDVFLGDGAGGLSLLTTVASATAVGVAVADFNGDGVPDLAITGAGQSSIYIGAGDGTFVHEADFSHAFNSELALAVADMDRNGRPDLVYVGQDGVGVMQNASAWPTSNTFVGRPPIALPVTAFSVRTVDADRNGTADLLVSLSGIDTLQVYSGTGGGTFGISRNVSTGSQPFDSIPVDLDLDGKLDAVTAKGAAATVSVQLDTGGTYGADSPVGTSGTAFSLAVDDFNRDGKGDVSVLDFNGKVDFLTGNGGGLTLAATLNTGGTPGGFAFADFNRDGLPDLAVTDTAGSAISVFVASSPLNYPTPGATLTVNNTPTQIVAGDFDRDGLVDLATANQDGTVSVLFNNAGSFPSVSLSLPAAANPGGLAVADFNRDGFLDIAVTDASSNVVEVFFGAPGGTFTGPGVFPTGAGPGRIAVGDFNGDGLPDMAISNQTDNTVSILLGQ